MYEPLELMLKDGKPNIKFMFCWANEQWTKKWDGGNNDILLEQDYIDVSGNICGSEKYMPAVPHKARRYCRSGKILSGEKCIQILLLRILIGVDGFERTIPVSKIGQTNVAFLSWFLMQGVRHYIFGNKKTCHVKQEDCARSASDGACTVKTLWNLQCFGITH